MTAERRQHLRSAWGATLTFVRNWVSLVMGCVLMLASIHPAVMHEKDFNWPAVGMASIGWLAIFGWQGLQVYREIKGIGQGGQGEARPG